MSSVLLRSKPPCGRTGPLLSHRQARNGVVIRAAADNQLLKKPELKRPEPEQKKLFNDASAVSTATATKPSGSLSGGVTIEYQRQRAKEMRQYFIDMRAEEMRVKSKVFGWTPKNEISNGRWVMFGLLVGMLTEYATGVDFIDQLKLMATYLGIVDID
ncbi:hypothetical protein Agub_g8566 [Astrephomene gubernaculifera]|uniref:Uncharacterized protein n=1 Tax=Astrephomene gubernaculifera TaxID=47775 RepID=A0AAD3DRV9_9CHLO|nr:hypothetical protein Agub_g8566 [Astrephomene gubernaculifera]